MQEEHLERLRTLHHQESQQVDQVCRMLKTDMNAVASQPEELLHQFKILAGLHVGALEDLKAQRLMQGAHLFIIISRVD